SLARCNQKSAIIVLGHRPDAVSLRRQWIELWRARFPSPQPIRHTHPKILFPVLVQTNHPMAQTAIFAVAMDSAVLNAAKPPRRRKSDDACPYRAFVVLNEPQNQLSRDFGILGELSVLPACQPLQGPDPKSSVARGQQAHYPLGREVLAW